MVIKSYHIILAVKILGWFLLKWAGFGEPLGWISSTRSGNTALETSSLRVSWVRAHRRSAQCVSVCQLWEMGDLLQSLRDFINCLDQQSLPRVLQVSSGVYFQGRFTLSSCIFRMSLYQGIKTLNKNHTSPKVYICYGVPLCPYIYFALWLFYVSCNHHNFVK